MTKSPTQAARFPLTLGPLGLPVRSTPSIGWGCNEVVIPRPAARFAGFERLVLEPDLARRPALPPIRAPARRRCRPGSARGRQLARPRSVEPTGSRPMRAPLKGILSRLLRAASSTASNDSSPWSSALIGRRQNCDNAQEDCPAQPLRTYVRPGCRHGQPSSRRSPRVAPSHGSVPARHRR